MRGAAVKSQAYRYGACALLTALGVIVVAHGFELFGGYTPCPLCLQQRWAYYLGIPATFLALILLTGGRTAWAVWAFFLVSLVYLANAGLGTYHAGAEWKYWPGPETCSTSAAISPNAGGLLKQLETTRVSRCDEAPWRFLGLSFAGWNVLVSFLLWITLSQAAFSAAAQPKQKLSI